MDPKLDPAFLDSGVLPLPRIVITYNNNNRVSHSTCSVHVANNRESCSARPQYPVIPTVSPLHGTSHPRSRRDSLLHGTLHPARPLGASCRSDPCRPGPIYRVRLLHSVSVRFVCFPHQRQLSFGECWGFCFPSCLCFVISSLDSTLFVMILR